MVLLQKIYRLLILCNIYTKKYCVCVYKLQILKVVYLKFRQPTINRINFETSDNIFKMFKIEQFILQRINRTNYILLHIIEIFKKTDITT